MFCRILTKMINRVTLDAGNFILRTRSYDNGPGRYLAVNVLVGLKDFLGQVLPGPEETATGGEGGPPGLLLRRAKEYEVRRMEVGHTILLDTWCRRGVICCCRYYISSMRVSCVEALYGALVVRSIGCPVYSGCPAHNQSV